MHTSRTPSDFAESRLKGGAILLWCGFSALYMAVVARLAATKLLWYDEIFTWHLSWLPTLGAVWEALATGPDLNPPLYFVATRLTFSLFGPGPLGMRLPASFGVMCMALCLYGFVARRCGRAYGWIAALLPLTAEAFPYAYEGRAYGLVLGLGALALFSWQTAANDAIGGFGRWGALIGLAASLAAALASHFYAVLLFAPLGLAELARTGLRRRVDLGVGLALGSPMLVLVPLRPLIVNARAYANSFWAKPTVATVFQTYSTLLGDTVPFLVAISVLGALWWAIRLRKGHAHPGGTTAPIGSPSLPELVASAAFCALPIFAYALGKLATGAFAERYALPSLLGFALLLGFGAHHAARGRTAPGVAVALLLFAGFSVNVARQARELARTQPATYTLVEHMGLENGFNGPVVVADPLLYLQAVHYAPPAVVDRLVYVMTDNSTPELGLAGLRRWVPLRVEEYNAFLATGTPFLIYRLTSDASTPHLPNTLLERLARDEVPLDIRAWTSREIVVACYPDRSVGGGRRHSAEPSEQPQRKSGGTPRVFDGRVRPVEDTPIEDDRPAARAPSPSARRLLRIHIAPTSPQSGRDRTWREAKAGSRAALRRVQTSILPNRALGS
jgi:hypothetical protein